MAGRAKADYGANLIEHSYALNGARFALVALKNPHCDAILWFASLALRSWNVSDKCHFRWMETAWGVRFPPFTDFKGTDPNVCVVSEAVEDAAILKRPLLGPDCVKRWCCGRFRSVLEAVPG